MGMLRCGSWVLTMWVLWVLLVCGKQTIAWNTASLVPPPGNSVQIKAKAVNGAHFYRCVDGEWLVESAYATLVNRDNPTAILGNYSYTYRARQPQYIGTFAFVNSAGDAAESGSAASFVAGTKIATFSFSEEHLSEFLAEASMHQSYGTASFISYISRLNTYGGMPPANGYCGDEIVRRIPFQADFYFWKQDAVPPSVPKQLMVPSQRRPIDSFFAKGVVEYVFNGGEWTQKDVIAKMYDVPGGSQVGSFFIRSKPDSRGGSYCWEISNPNGFEIVGKFACAPMSVTTGSLPWSLNTITSSSGNTSLLGPYAYVQMLSTRGGLPPRNYAAKKPREGQVWRSSYTAVYWFYCSI